MSVVRDLRAPPALVFTYYLTVAPEVRRELDHWRRRARRIPNRRLRAFACQKLAGEHLNAEAAAVFATLVPRPHRRMAARLMVAFEVMYDFLDAVSEQPSPEPVRNGLRLHEALIAAIAPRPPADFDPYAFGDLGDDGGYLEEIAAACRERFASLPAAEVVGPALLRSAARCGEGQTRTHAVEQLGPDQLRSWGRTLTGWDRYAWWELTAGAASSLVLHALMAAAGDPRTTSETARHVECAYFPAVCTLSTLLDAFIDRGQDAARGVHNYGRYYVSADACAARLAVVAADAERAVRRLPCGERHATIVAGVCAFYLSALTTHGAVDGASKSHLNRALHPATFRPLLALVRLKRQLEAAGPVRSRGSPGRAADRRRASARGRRRRGLWSRRRS